MVIFGPTDNTVAAGVSGTILSGLSMGLYDEE